MADNLESIGDREAGVLEDVVLDEVVVTAERDKFYIGFGTDGAWSTDDSVKNDPGISVGTDGVGVGGPLVGADLGRIGSVVMTGSAHVDPFDQAGNVEAGVVYAPREQVGPLRSLSVDFNNNVGMDGDIGTEIQTNIEFDAPDKFFGEDASINVTCDLDSGSPLTSGVSFSVSKPF